MEFDAKSKSLKTTTINALFWSFIESVGLLITKFIISVILARLLFPEQFGLIGMLAIFFGIAQTFLDSGFGSALIQKKDANHIDLCSIFYFNIVVGVCISILLYFVSPWIAKFYEQPVLISLTRLLSLTIIFNSFGLIQYTILRKDVDFKTQSLINMAASIMSGIIGISMALNHFGVWSLAVQQISASFFRTILFWLICPWRPSPIFSIDSLQLLFGYGSKILSASLLNQIFSNIYLLVIGKLFSAIELGFYTRARSLVELPSSMIPQMVGRVMFPVLSIIQNDPARLKKGMRKSLIMSGFIYFPVMIGLAAVARPLVSLMLTDKWLDAVPYLQLLCFAWVLFPIHIINLNLLQSVGRSDLFLKLELIKKALTVINIVVTWRWGIQAMIFGMVFLSFVAYFLNSYYTSSLILYSVREQLRDWGSYFIMSAIMGCIVFIIGTTLILHLFWVLCIQIFSGIITYAFLCWVFRLEAFMDIISFDWKKYLGSVR